GARQNLDLASRGRKASMEARCVSERALFDRRSLANANRWHHRATTDDDTRRWTAEPRPRRSATRYRTAANTRRSNPLRIVSYAAKVRLDRKREMLRIAS